MLSYQYSLHFLFWAVALLFIILIDSAKVAAVLPRSRSVLVKVRVDVSKYKLALQSIGFPNIIPLLYGNSIINYKRTDENLYEIFHTASTKTLIHPMKSRVSSKNIAAFVFKQSSLGAYPVPMENSLLLLKVIPRKKSARIFIWLVSHGIYTQSQLIKQRIYMRSLVSEFADNARRVLGVARCRSLITVSGLCNHRSNAKSGTTLHELISPMQLTRSTSSYIRSKTPNVRQISNVLVKSTHNNVAPFNMNLWFVIFGQFIDHEIVLTPNDAIDPESSVPIIEPQTNLSMSFTRAAILRYSYNSCCVEKYKISKRVWEGMPFNRLTSLIDGSAVYGSNHLRVNTLRAFRQGKIKLQFVDKEELMPFNNPSQLKFTLHNEPSDHDRMLFAAGDVRANENIYLAAMHTLFAREHNRICDDLIQHLKHKGFKRVLRDSWIFATARQILSAEMQSILFNEWLPLLLGENSLPVWRGYNSSLDASISVLHSSFAFRWGHSAIPETFYLRDRRGSDHFKTLREVFFNTNEFLRIGMDNIIKGAMNTSAMDIDEQIVESLRNSLFKPPEENTMDLSSLNLQRLRDLGIPSYDNLQEHFGTGTGLNNIPEDKQQQLRDVYGADKNIDGFLGALCEKKKPGSLLGPLNHAINLDQFIRLRDGDRFYYENIEWHHALKDWDRVKLIRSHKYRMSHMVFANTKLKPSEFKDGVSFFKTISLTKETV